MFMCIREYAEWESKDGSVQIWYEESEFDIEYSLIGDPSTLSDEEFKEFEEEAEGRNLEYKKRGNNNE